MRLAGSGAGAAAIACLDLLVAIGLKREKITICDSKGVVHRGRQDLDADKARYATDTSARTLAFGTPPRKSSALTCAPIQSGSVSLQRASA